VENANIGIAGENMIAAGTSVRLPVMSLPTFDGTYEQWPVFYSTFSALVDKNQNLSNVHKFYYLQSALNANAKKIIESLEINEVNYPRAINLLKTRFDNSRLATRHHTRAIFSLKPIEKESSSQLRNLTDCLKQHLEALKALKYATETWCPLIIEWILTRLDPVTAREWEEKTVQKQEYKTKDFIAFLEAKCNMLESVNAFDSTKKDSDKSNKKNKGVAHVTNDSKLTCPSTSPEILLSTAWVHIVDRKGKLHNARALLDNGATLNFITSDLLNKLDLEPKKVEGRVTGFRGNTTLTREMASQRRFGPLRVEELTAANTALVKMAQRQAFAREIWDKVILLKAKPFKAGRMLRARKFELSREKGDSTSGKRADRAARAAAQEGTKKAG
ncbi:Uncharacterized protein DBV15_12594, partial [Temnothorax longispinosus]